MFQYARRGFVYFVYILSITDLSDLAKIQLSWKEKIHLVI